MGEPKIAAEDLASIKEMLKICYLFQEVEDAALEYAAFNLDLLTFQKGDPIILENEPNDQVYFIKEGSVEIVSYIPEEKRVQRLALLKSGKQFAEFSILNKSSRSGSAYAYEECELLCMKGAAFLEMLKRFPTVALRLLKLLAELHHKNEVTNDFIPFFKPELISLNKEVITLVPFANWTKFGIIPLSYKAGVLAVAVKDPNQTAFYQFIKAARPQVEVALYLINDTEFDNMAEYAIELMNKPPVTSAPPLRAALPADNTFDILKGSDLFGHLPENVLRQIAPLVQPQTVAAGTTLVTPGMSLSVYYLIVRGEAQLYRPVSRGNGVAQTMTLTGGEGFGETQIVAEKPSNSFVRATEETVILPIQKEIFQQLIPASQFAIPVTQATIKKIQATGHFAGFQYYKRENNPDFKMVASLLPLNLMMETKMVPLQVIDNELTLGVVRHDPSSILSVTARYVLDYRVKVMGISEEQFKVYFNNLKALDEQMGVEAASAKSKHAGMNSMQMVDYFILNGINNRSSDIHFEPSEHHMTVRYRIDGVLRESPDKIPLEYTKELIGRLKILSNMDISQNKLPQDGQLKTSIQGVTVMARSSCLPIKYGEKVVLRLIRSKNSVTPLNMIAPDRRTIQLLQAVTRCKQGLFLVTGPTGSGKTTTLYSMLNAINYVNTNIVTLEDPIEMEVPGFNQIEIDRKRGLEFDVALRSVLRQDPDVMMVGEIRDTESAKIVFEAAITGHLVFSTLHTNSSIDVCARLHELGVPSGTISAGLLGVLTQRLLRAICKKCSTPRPTTDSEKQFFMELLRMENPPEELRFGKGCPTCHHSGYFDRIPVIEMWRTTLPMRSALARGAGMQELFEIARQDGFETLLEFGLKMAISGLTTLEEVKRVLSQV